MTSSPRSATAALKTQYMALYAHKDCALITVKELCAAAGVARFVAAWKESIKQNFARRYPHKRHIPNYALVSEIVGSEAIGAYTYWLSNPDGVRTEDIKPLIDRTLSSITPLL